jgi:hypothetical protein
VFTFDTWLTENTVLSGAGTPVTFSNLAEGSYSFSETALPSGWAIESVSCSDGESTEIDLDETLSGVTVNISNGENVTCVVTNRYTDGGSNEDGEYIIVRKQVTENSDTTKSFGFEASWLDEEGPADFSLTSGTEYKSGNLLSGQVYSVSEILEKGSGWSQTSASCVSSDEQREGNIFPGEFVLNDGETITCTFTNDQELYQLEGFVWEDNDEDGIFDADESPLANWGVNAAAEGQTTRETNSDATGYYKFTVPAGTWTITEDLQSGWNAVHPNPTQYVVTVPAVPVEEFTMFDSFMQIILPTAEAAVIGAPIDELNFGNKQIPSRGGSSGSRRKRPVETPVPQVLGEATSTMPVGAPNTGAGGTAPMLPAEKLVADAVASITFRRTKNAQ